MDCLRDEYLEPFLLSLFKFFEKNNIEFLILRNYLELPRHLRDGGDIDFVLSESSFRRIHKVLACMDDLDILVFSKRTVVQEFIVRYKENLFIKLDFHPYEDWHGAVYLTSRVIFDSSQKYNMFYVPSDFHQALTMLLASYLYGAFIKNKYMNFSKPILAQSSELKEFIPIFGKKNVCAIQDFAKGAISENELLKRRYSVLINLFVYNLKLDGLSFLFRFAKTRIEEIVFRIQYKGLIISLKTENNTKVIEHLRCFFETFLGKDRFLVIGENTSLKMKLKSWDQVGRLKFLVYDNYSSILLRKPDIVIVNELTAISEIVGFLIRREKGICQRNVLSL